MDRAAAGAHLFLSLATTLSPTAWPHHHFYLFSNKQLNSFDATAVLAFSTIVPLSDIAFSTTVLGFLVGAALPTLYILDGLCSGDTAGVTTASPHAFLLATQIFTEGLAAAWPRRFSLPVQPPLRAAAG
uniref:DUF7733 domain-containing protein n=1 Tax=Oryza glumipatula TaxID=40148 RepID=A0A0D9ZCI6_9ORYZ